MNSWIWFMFVLIGIWSIAVQIGGSDDALDLVDLLDADIAGRYQNEQPLVRNSDDTEAKIILDLIRKFDAAKKVKNLKLSKRPAWWPCVICGNSRTNTRKR